MSTLRLLGDVVSPVTRAVILFLEVNSVPYEFIHIALAKGETQTNPELAAINPNKRVPAINDNGFTMFESAAIMRYLFNKHRLPDHWYPSDLQARAKVDEAVVWFNGNLRCGCFYHHAIIPRKTGQPMNEVKCAETRGILKNSLELVENYFLKTTSFVAGNEMSIADLLFLCETTQYWLAGHELYKERPNMAAWMERCRKALAPKFDEIFAPIYEIQKSGRLATPINI